MKAKLSFLALPLRKGLAPVLCLGLVVAFVLAACGEDSPTKPDPTPGPGGGYSSVGNSDSPKGDVVFVGEELITGDRWVDIIGDAVAIVADPLKSVKYSISSPGKLGWLLYGGDRVPLTDGSIPIPLNPDGTNTHSVTIAVKIDLKNNDDIPCGQEFTVNIVAINQSGSSATRSFKFTRDNSFCALNSSPAPLSSSSVISWRFDVPPVEGQAYASTDPRGSGSYQIGSGSFLILGDPDQYSAPDLKISGGKVRIPEAVCNDDKTINGDGGNISGDVAYSTKSTCLGNTPAQKESLTEIDPDNSISKEDYFLVYLNDGEVYLLYITSTDGGTIKWPVKYMYWRAKEKPANP